MSRRKKRYENRQKRRQEKRNDFLRGFDRFENVSSFKALYTAAIDAAKGVTWKASVQRYLLNVILRTAGARQDLLEGKDIRKGFICFDINERGKLRHIRSVHFSERVVQKSLCQNVLLPILTHNLIYDNGASQKNKGTLFAINRLVTHLRRHFRRYGQEGYVLLIDFKSYFDNIDHDVLKGIYRKYIKDADILKLTDDFVDAFGEKGLGLGSETSQIHAIAYPNAIDHFIKDQCGFKAYGRYMDDSYIISHDKQQLEDVLQKLTKLYDTHKITASPKKTRIVDLKHGFCFLKTRFFITKTGKILKKPCRRSITVERRKLKKQGKLVETGQMTEKDVLTSFVSWTGSMKRRNAAKTVYNMTQLLKRILYHEKQRYTTRALRKAPIIVAN
ncbi:MAG: RNA-directed DNA polymerase [Alphaproteobacteria bacterium]|nr:RNA-directed DNA polymerase [Alphaproteobacteria bacterium]